MTTKKKIGFGCLLFLLTNLLAPLFYWLWFKHRKAFWTCLVLMYLAGIVIYGFAFYIMMGHSDI